MGVFMYVVHGHCGPLGPHAGPHTSWDPVVGSHIFAAPDGGLVGLVGLVGSVVGFRFGGLVSSFAGAGVWAFSCPTGPRPGTARPPRGWGRAGAGPPRRGSCRPGIPPKQHHTSVHGYHGRCPSTLSLPSLPRWGRVKGRPSRRSDPRDGRPSSQHPWGCRSWLGGEMGAWAVAILGGLVGLGAETAFVGRAVVVVVRGGWAFCYGGSPCRRSPSPT